LSGKGARVRDQCLEIENQNRIVNQFIGLVLIVEPVEILVWESDALILAGAEGDERDGVSPSRKGGEGRKAVLGRGRYS